MKRFTWQMHESICPQSFTLWIYCCTTTTNRPKVSKILHLNVSYNTSFAFLVSSKKKKETDSHQLKISYWTNQLPLVRFSFIQNAAAACCSCCKMWVCWSELRLGITASDVFPVNFSVRWLPAQSLLAASRT